MRPLRVRAFYTRYPHWGAYAGGHQVCRHLDPAVVDVSLRPVADSDDEWPLPANPLNRRLKARFAARGMAWYKLSDLAAEIRALPAALSNTIDLAHFLDAEHTGQYLPGWIRTLRLSRVRTIGTFHQPPELLPDLVNRDVVAQLDQVFLVSPTQEPFFRAILPAERVRTILHGIDTSFFRPGPSGAARTRFTCITAGHWMRDWVSVRAVAEAFSSDRDVAFHVVTNRETGLEGLANVFVHRNVDDEMLRSLYQDADVLFLPLINATANNSLLEGMACGLPVVSTDIESVRAYLGDSTADLIQGNSPQAFVDAIVRHRDDIGYRRLAAASSRARAEQLAWPAVACQWERAYQDVVDRH